MKKRLVQLLLVLPLFLCLYHDLTYAETWPISREVLTAESPVELHTIVPDGVTEIDLQVALGDGAADVEDAWMLNTNVCVILQRLPNRGYGLILIDMRDLSTLSQTPVPHAEYFAGQNWDDGALHLLFKPEGSNRSDFAFSCIKATVSTDGAVDVGVSDALFTVMPGGKTAIREAYNGSLYAVDLATGEEELLIQGVAGLGGGLNYEDFLAYVPCLDDIGYDGVGPWGHPMPTSYPKDADTFRDFDFLFFRRFYVYKTLDEHRFVYAVDGWEWGAGFGVYDLQTRTDHRITGRGSFYGMGGSILYGSTLMADANTYEFLPLSETVQEQFEWASVKVGGSVDYSISPDSKLLALTGMKSMRNDASTVTLTEIQTGSIIKTYDIYNPFAIECRVAFYSDTRFMLFCAPEELGTAYIYLFNVEE